MINATAHVHGEASGFEFRALAEAVNYRRRLVEAFAPWIGGHVLEVGAGVGQITSVLKQCSALEKLVAVEPNLDFAAEFRTHAPDVELINGTVEAVGADRAWDAIVSVNVLEHIEGDDAELQRYRQLLKQGTGALCLFVPARPEIYAPIDKDLGHFRRYTRNGLRRKLTRAGFAIKRLRYFNMVGYFAWWWTFCLLKRRSFNVGAVRFFDRRIFPLASQIERWLHPPLGQSLLAVAAPVQPDQ